MGANNPEKSSEQILEQAHNIDTPQAHIENNENSNKEEGKRNMCQKHSWIQIPQ